MRRTLSQQLFLTFPRTNQTRNILSKQGAYPTNFPNALLYDFFRLCSDCEMFFNNPNKNYPDRFNGECTSTSLQYPDYTILFDRESDTRLIAPPPRIFVSLTRPFLSLNLSLLSFPSYPTLCSPSPSLTLTM